MIFIKVSIFLKLENMKGKLISLPFPPRHTTVTPFSFLFPSFPFSFLFSPKLLSKHSVSLQSPNILNFVQHIRKQFPTRTEKARFSKVLQYCSTFFYALCFDIQSLSSYLCIDRPNINPPSFSPLLSKLETFHRLNICFLCVLSCAFRKKYCFFSDYFFAKTL